MSMTRVTLCFFLLLAALAGISAPRAASWTVDGQLLLATLDDGRLRMARVTPAGVEELAVIPSPGFTTLAAGTWNGTATLLGGQGKTLLRFDPAARAWVKVGSLPGSIREILPARDGRPGAVVLTGGAEAVPKDGAVWWATWGKAFACARVGAIKPNYRPWQVWWSARDGEERLAVATYKATKYAPFEHNCMFLFTWQDGIAEPCWLGSRLTRPYLEAAHADLRGDGRWRLAAVEKTKDGGRGLSVYEPIRFGYANEWKTEAIPGLQHVAAFGDAILCSGTDAAGAVVAWQLLPEADGYRLAALSEAPPSLDRLTRIDADRLAGWWDGGWHILPIRPATREGEAPAEPRS
ncbi:MAG: hypothetical protein ACYDCO_11705 [Armatimonadota bacterium]